MFVLSKIRVEFHPLRMDGHGVRVTTLPFKRHCQIPLALVEVREIVLEIAWLNESFDSVKTVY